VKAENKNYQLSEGKNLISFSGGRSSAYMLYQILQENKGKCPDNAVIVFANTGREMPQTLDFVYQCSIRWGVNIVWLEHNYDDEGCATYDIVDYESASRNGEPFSRLIDKRKFLPNAVARFCTQDLKIRTFERYMKRELGFREYTNVIGIRADEPRRIAKAAAANEIQWKEKKYPRVSELLLAKNSVTRFDVAEFWRNSDFDLELVNDSGSTPMGNCDLCFLKGISKISSIIRDYPDRAEWWLEQEEKVAKGCNSVGVSSDNASFIKYIPYKSLAGYANENFFDDDAMSCIGCTD